MSEGRSVCVDQDETNRLYIQLHYQDMVAQIAEGKRSAWSVVQWTFALIGAVAGIYITNKASTNVALVQVGIVGIGLMGVALLFAVRADIRAHRDCLIKLRKRVMGAWTNEIFGPLPSKARWSLIVHIGMVLLGTGAVTLALGMV